MAENVATIKITGDAVQAIAEMDRAKKAAELMERAVNSGGGMAGGMNRAATSMRRFGNEAKQGTRGAADGMMQLAIFADDAQYGLRGVLNNIPGMVMGFGAAAKTAGAVSIIVLGWAKIFDGSTKRWGQALYSMFSETEKQLAKNTAAFIRQTDEWNEAFQKAKDERIAMLKDEMAQAERMMQARADMTDFSQSRMTEQLAQEAEKFRLVQESMRLRVNEFLGGEDSTDPRRKAAMDVLDRQQLEFDQAQKIAQAEENITAAKQAHLDVLDKIAIAEEKIAQITAANEGEGNAETEALSAQVQDLRASLDLYEAKTRAAKENLDILRQTNAQETFLLNQRQTSSDADLRKKRVEQLTEKRDDVTDSLMQLSEQIRMPLTSLQQIGGERAESPYGLGGDIARRQLDKLTEINNSIRRLRAGYN